MSGQYYIYLTLFVGGLAFMTFEGIRILRFSPAKRAKSAKRRTPRGESLDPHVYLRRHLVPGLLMMVALGLVLSALFVWGAPEAERSRTVTVCAVGFVVFIGWFGLIGWLTYKLKVADARDARASRELN